MHDWFDPIGEEDLRYRYQRVQLSLLPSAAMTWSMWFRAAVTIGTFLEGYNCVAFDYEVELLEIHGVVGSGSLEESDGLTGDGGGTSINRRLRS